MRGSNTRPPDYETDALPTELTPLDDKCLATTKYKQVCIGRNQNDMK